MRSLTICLTVVVYFPFERCPFRLATMQSLSMEAKINSTRSAALATLAAFVSLMFGPSDQG